jgi:elongation factor G
MTTYPPVISVPLKPRDAEGAVELRAALDVISAFDPGLGAEPRSANEVLLTGQSELQLETAIDYAKRAFKLDFDVGAPQVAYRGGRSSGSTPIGSILARQSNMRGSRFGSSPVNPAAASCLRT